MVIGKNLTLKYLALTAFAVSAITIGSNTASAKALYGAIAYSTKSGAFGFATDYAAQKSAERDALSECKTRGGGCKATIWFKNACGSFALGDDGWGASWGATPEKSKSEAIIECKKETKNCEVRKTICTSNY